MNIIAKCPHCGCAWWLDGSAAGCRVRCRKCRTLLKVPDLKEVPKAAGVIRNAAGDLYVDDTGKLFG
jgi:hypothetical protein